MVTAHSARYGPQHKRLRAAWAVVVLEGRATCVRCHVAIPPGTRWDLDHTDDGRGYLGPSHHSCNRRAGAIKRNTERGLPLAAIAKRRRSVMQLEEPKFGVDLSGDRSRAAVVTAGWTQHPTAGRVIGARLDLFRGPDVSAIWEHLQELEKRPEAALPKSGHSRVIENGLTGLGAVVVLADTADLDHAQGRLEDIVRAGQLRRQESRVLDEAVEWGKTRKLTSDGQVFDKRRSGVDVAPLVALSLAVWLVVRKDDEGRRYNVLDSVL